MSLVRPTKAVITAAAQRQRTLPLQVLIDQDGVERSVLAIIAREIRRARIEEIAVVVWPGDEDAYRKALGDEASGIRFFPQGESRGYGHALATARGFTKDEPFLHLVGDHIYLGDRDGGAVGRLVDVAAEAGCCVSAVQVTREHLLPLYGAIGGRRVSGKEGVYRVDTVLEKPTPTEAEQRLFVPGMRAGHYLCFFGMHVLTPAVLEILAAHLAADPNARPSLSEALAELAGREEYLAVEQSGTRFDIGVKYGLLAAQLAFGLSGSDREAVLALLLDTVAARGLESRGTAA